jgi:Domain of unknown function (DUF4395)
MSASTPGRRIDPRGHRFSAGLSAILLAVAVLAGATWVVPLMAIALGVSAAFGTRYWILGRAWPPARRLLRLGPPHDLEHEYPPRFAQAMGATFLGIGSVLLALGITPWGWIPVVAVIALQTLLAVTGFCLGCRLFFVRWIVPDLFARAIGRGAQREALVRVPRR